MEHVRLELWISRAFADYLSELADADARSRKQYAEIALKNATGFVESTDAVAGPPDANRVKAAKTVPAKSKASKKPTLKVRRKKQKQVPIDNFL